MKPEERRSIHNGIYLCGPCSIKIDRDDEHYPASLLRDWKRRAEETARLEQNQRQTPEIDSRKQLVAILTGSSADALPRAIGNAHRAVSTALEAADPRFKVSSTFDGEVTNFVLDARENVELSIQIKPTIAPEWNRRMGLLHEEGQPFEISTEGIRILGSDIFEKMGLGGAVPGKLSVEGVAHGARLRLTLHHPTSGRAETLDDVLGTLRGGVGAAVFDGTLFEGLVDISVRIDTANRVEHHAFTLSPNLPQWSGLAVDELPYYDQVRDLFDCFADGWSIEGRLQIQGRTLFRIRLNISTGPKEPIAETLALLRYTDLARRLKAQWHCPIRFDVGDGLSPDNFKELARAVTMAEGSLHFDASSLRGNPTCTLLATEAGENISWVRNGGEGVFRFEKSPETVLVFHQVIDTPPIEIVMNRVAARVLREPGQVHVGDAVPIEWVPMHGFNGFMRYDVPGDEAAR